MPRLLIASPHRYPDLARLWHRVVMHELVPAFERIGLDVEVNIFCDANADQFLPHWFPRILFTRAGPGMRDNLLISRSVCGILSGPHERANSYHRPEVYWSRQTAC